MVGSHQGIRIIAELDLARGRTDIKRALSLARRNVPQIHLARDVTGCQHSAWTERHAACIVLAPQTEIHLEVSQLWSSVHFERSADATIVILATADHRHVATVVGRDWIQALLNFYRSDRHSQPPRFRIDHEPYSWTLFAVNCLRLLLIPLGTFHRERKGLGPRAREVRRNAFLSDTGKPLAVGEWQTRNR